MQHKLSLEAPDTLNPCLLRLVDTSIYNADMPIKCPTLQITPPGADEANTVDNIQAEFIKSLTACDLKLQLSNCGTTFNNLSDGIYIIRYSVSPNDIVYVEYNHLRTTMAQIRIREILCELDLANCQPSEQTLAKLRKVMDIQGYLLAAKASVEYCQQPRKGMDIFNYAVSQLNKIECRTCKK